MQRCQEHSVCYLYQSRYQFFFIFQNKLFPCRDSLPCTCTVLPKSYLINLRTVWRGEPRIVLENIEHLQRSLLYVSYFFGQLAARLAIRTIATDHKGSLFFLSKIDRHFAIIPDTSVVDASSQSNFLMISLLVLQSAPLSRLRKYYKNP